MKKFLTLAAAAAATVIGLPTLAANPYFDVKDHVSLLQAVENAGTAVVINNPNVCGNGFYGSYLARQDAYSILAVCQENRSETSDQVVQMTAEDADTIRHEAWHMVQDCVYGGMRDAYLRAIYNTPDEVVQFARDSGMSNEFISNIIEAYEDEEWYVIVAEIEAFTVAETMSAEAIETLVSKYCAHV